MPKKVEKRTTRKTTKKPVTKAAAEPKKTKRKAATRKRSVKSKAKSKNWSKASVAGFYDFVSKSVEEMYGEKVPAKLRELAAAGREIKEKVYRDAVAKDLRATEAKYFPTADMLRLVEMSVNQATDILKTFDLDDVYKLASDTMMTMLAHFGTGIEGLEKLNKSCAATSRSAYKNMCDKRTQIQEELAAYQKTVAELGEEAAARIYITKSAEGMKKDAAEMLEKVKEAEQKCKELEAAAQLLERVEAELNKD